MTKSELDQIRARADAATEGPWQVCMADLGRNYNASEGEKTASQFNSGRI